MAIRPPPSPPPISPLWLVCLIGFTLFVVGFVVGRLTH